MGHTTQISKKLEASTRKIAMYTFEILPNIFKFIILKNGVG